MLGMGIVRPGSEGAVTTAEAEPRRAVVTPVSRAEQTGQPAPLIRAMMPLPCEAQ